MQLLKRAHELRRGVGAVDAGEAQQLFARVLIAREVVPCRIELKTGSEACFRGRVLRDVLHETLPMVGFEVNHYCHGGILTSDNSV